MVENIKSFDFYFIAAEIQFAISSSKCNFDKFDFKRSIPW